MSVSEKPPRDEAHAVATDEARTFKKTSTVHGHPRETDHDIHIDMLKSPPRNVPDGAVPGFVDDGMKAPTKNKRMADEVPVDGVMGEDILPGRKKPLDAQAELIDTSESTSRA